jgi:hypothetical protein
MAISDIVVVPSLYEPMGYVILEAMACARPVVASRVGGIVEMITDGQTGMLFTPGDADDLAEKLIVLHGDAGMRERIGREARSEVERRRSAADVVNDWQMLYRKTAFAFGESLYPDDDLLQSIREKCEETKVMERNVEFYGDKTVYDAPAFLGVSSELIRLLMGVYLICLMLQHSVVFWLERRSQRIQRSASCLLGYPLIAPL